jgi:hypothetical protein
VGCVVQFSPCIHPLLKNSPMFFTR